MNILDFKKAKGVSPLTMLTCYDFWSAKILNQSKVDALLVGDSVAMVCHGFDNTLHADMPMMESHTAAVARGAPQKLIIADLPFLSFRLGKFHAAECAGKLLRAGAQAVKLEGVTGHEDVVEHLVGSGIPVMGHIGLTPQSVHQLGGFRVQGKENQAALRLQAEALRLQELGCFAVVLECVPSSLAQIITQSLKIPTIGIGAGPLVDGQVLVLQDMLGASGEFRPKFLKTYADLDGQIRAAADTFAAETGAGDFPSEKESYA